MKSYTQPIDGYEILRCSMSKEGHVADVLVGEIPFVFDTMTSVNGRNIYYLGYTNGEHYISEIGKWSFPGTYHLTVRVWHCDGRCNMEFYADPANELAVCRETGMKNYANCEVVGINNCIKRTLDEVIEFIASHELRDGEELKLHKIIQEELR